MYRPATLKTVSTRSMSRNAPTFPPAKSINPAQTRRQNPAYSQSVSVGITSFEEDADATCKLGRTRAYSLPDTEITSPQNRQKSPSGSAGLPQLTQTCGATGLCIDREILQPE